MVRCLVLIELLSLFASPSMATEPNGRIDLKPVAGTDWLEGTLTVHENRGTGVGRTIELYVVVLPASGAEKSPDALFYLDGGPGAGATRNARRLSNSWIRQHRDIVLVDQRGTGRSNPLPVDTTVADGGLQRLLEPVFVVDDFVRARAQLERRADLRFYTTPIAMDDLDDVREALGYETINLMGGSYGTRAALVYMRRHEARVRTATLIGVAPLAFRNPLYHARSAQDGLEKIFAEVEGDPNTAEAFPRLRQRFDEILSRLDREPVEVTVMRGQSAPETVRLGREAFGESLRVMMYYMPNNRRVPKLLEAAYHGDFKPFVETALQTSAALRGSLAMGMLMSVVGSEDIPRITEDDVVRETEGTFLGKGRVTRQMAVAAIWPRGDVPPDYGQPVRVATPTLVLSGSHDPVTPPRWGAEAASHLPNSMHLVVPGAHGGFGPVVDRIQQQFLNEGNVRQLDTSAVDRMRLPPFER